ncbi:hypothetical protein [uncultured Pseudokineococcus sp.]|uniref:hypothetical protein n=1 Tax=uncultured Pseudokineococcus sp. TaxID=1642928 RepID=UPI0026341B36|nr:hypothetical protein [uncultured Pseudokineococcus sp.]
MGDRTRTALLTVPQLHSTFTDALASVLAAGGDPANTGSKPLDLTCGPPLPRQLRVYLFNATDHPSERKSGDYRIQMRLPGQRAGERGQLDVPAQGLLLLAGYVSEFNVFVLWDASAHEQFPFSKGVQVGASTVHQAAITGLMEQGRTIRSAGRQEVVVAARHDHLVAAIQRRDELTREILLRDSRESQ